MRLVLWACLGLGALMGVGVAIALLTRGEGESASVPTAPTAPATTAPAPPPQPPPPVQLRGAEIGDLRIVSVSSFEATVAWRTGGPTEGWVAVGPPGETPTLWWRYRHASRRHTVRLDGLAFGTPYDISVTSVASDGSRHSALTSVQTPLPPAGATATVRGGRVLVDGHPFFPILSWGECVDGFETSLPVGTNLYAGNRCGGLGAQLDWLKGRALSLAVPEEHAAGHGVAGRYYPDEPDGRGLFGKALPELPAADGARFLTLTNHFYSGAAPLTYGRAIYPGLIEKADVIGFDLYPLQNWCRPERLADVYLAQRELVKLSEGRPTYQWIEAAGMTCPHTGATEVTPATVRAESWLAIAGGARGLGFFPPAAWTGDVGRAIAEVTAATRYLTPALLASDAPVSAEPVSGPVKVAARELNGALYIIVANSSYEGAGVRISAPGLDGRQIQTLQGDHVATPAGDSFDVRLPPLGARVYVAAPSGSSGS